VQIRPNELASHIKGPLRAVYLIAGDETLLVEEACDAIIAAAKTQGFSERSIHHVETGFKWHNLTHDAASLSLFAERKLLDVRVPANKLDREASDALREWTADIDTDALPETILLLRTGRLDGNKRKSAWFKAIDAVGAITLIWPMGDGELPRWMMQRAGQENLEIEPDAIQYLCDRVEGNLLAAAQEIHKIGLMQLTQPVTLDALVTSIDDTSRYNSFDLLDAVMARHPQKAHKILHNLRAEGVALFAILGALTSQLRRLDGPSFNMPKNRQELLRDFASRVRDVKPVLAECAVVDAQGKGQLPGDPWVSLEQILLRLAGIRVLSVPSRDQKLASVNG
jgi:DNA polymerase-3 subunit delta